MNSNPNVELLEKTMQFIVDYPDEHDQSEVWLDCETPGCFVGWAMHFMGLGQESYFDLRGSSVDWAVENLGIEFWDAQILFAGTNTIPMLQLMVKDLVNGDHLPNCRHYREIAHSVGEGDV